ncbi:MAG: hypothetical protein AAF492_20690 [Verrucomicrobiota bacterium]
MLLIVHLMLGFRRLRETETDRHDPLVGQVLGLKRLPDVSTISRGLKRQDKRSVTSVLAGNRRLVLDGLADQPLTCYTLDFDGSILSTQRCAEGSAAGFNRRRKGVHVAHYGPSTCRPPDQTREPAGINRPRRSENER